MTHNAESASNGPLSQDDMAVIGTMLAKTLDRQDEVREMSDADLVTQMRDGRWSTIEVHELIARFARLAGVDG